METGTREWDFEKPQSIGCFLEGEHSDDDDGQKFLANADPPVVLHVWHACDVFGINHKTVTCLKKHLSTSSKSILLVASTAHSKKHKKDAAKNIDKEELKVFQVAVATSFLGFSQTALMEQIFCLKKESIAAFKDVDEPKAAGDNELAEMLWEMLASAKTKWKELEKELEKVAFIPVTMQKKQANKN